jgi:hypothetical protein
VIRTHVFAAERIHAAIAACRKTDNTSDLYACAGGSLYYFASDNQKDHEASGATAFKLFDNEIFNKVRSLFASVASDGIVTVWGVDANDNVFYTTCPANALQTSSSWSYPLPIMKGVDKVSPFVNRANSANTFFAHLAGDELKVVVKSPGKSGLWTVRDVHLEPVDRKTKKKAQSFSSYTTRVQVTGPDNQPAGGKLVSVKAPSSVTSVYINHLYYVVGSSPIQVKTDPLGSLTIVEAVSRLDGTQFDLSVVDDGANRKIDPMRESPSVNDKLRELKDGGLNNDKWIYYQDPKKSRRRLIKQGANSADVAAGQRNIDNLWAAHDRLSGGRTAPVSAASTAPSSQYLAFVGQKTPVRVDAGDLFSMLDAKQAQHVLTAQAQGVRLGSGGSLWEAIVEFFEGVWKFVVKIGEAIFEFVFEVIEEVYAAFKYVLNLVVETIEDLIDFVKYLFDLDDIKRTKDVMKNLALLAFEEQLRGIKAFKHDVDVKIDEVVAAVDAWAGLEPDWAGLLGDEGKAAFDGKTAPLPATGAPEWLLQHHFGNAEYASAMSSDNLPDPPSNPLDVLLGAVQTEIGHLGDAFTQLQTLAKEAHTLSLVDVLKRLAGILAHLGLKTAKATFDALLDIIYDFAKSALALLDRNIYIPVISDILELFGVPEFSLLDAICYVGAVPVTVVFKLLQSGAPPFPDNADTRFLIDARDFQSVVERLSVTTMDAAVLAAPQLSPGKAEAFMAFRFLAGIYGFMALVVSASDLIEFDDLKTGVGVVNMSYGLGTGSCLWICSWVPPLTPNQTSVEQYVVRGIAGARLLAILGLNGGLRSMFFPKYERWSLTRGQLAGVDAVVAVILTGFTSYFISQMRYKSDQDSRNLAIADEVGSFCLYLSRGLRCGTIVATELKQGEVAVGFAAAAGFIQLVFVGVQFYEFDRVLKLKQKA